MPTGQDLLNLLGETAPVFGVAYSILSWSGLAKGVSLSPAGITKLAGKLVEDGHATAFMIADGKITLTGMGDGGWVFDSGPLKTKIWARETKNANTDVYFTGCSQEDVKKFRGIEADLSGKKDTKYHEFWPNVCGQTRYENCISSSHQIVHKMGFGSAIATKGVWIPSLSNWATWTATQFSAWRHKRIPNVNTHIP